MFCTATPLSERQRSLVKLFSTICWASLLSLLVVAGEAGAATSAAVRVPTDPAIRFVTLRFPAGPTPTLTIPSATLTGLPDDVTVVTGIAPDASGNGYIGLLSVVRWGEAGATAMGATNTVRVSASRAFTAGTDTRATWKRQLPDAYAKGAFSAGPGRMAKTWDDNVWGPRKTLLNELGKGFAGGGNPILFGNVVNQQPPNTFTVVVTPVGSGTGDIGDNFSLIDCDIVNGAVQGTCTQWYNVGTNLTFVYTQGFRTAFEKWTRECNPFNTPLRPCVMNNVGPAGRVVKLGGQFVAF